MLIRAGGYASLHIGVASALLFMWLALSILSTALFLYLLLFRSWHSRKRHIKRSKISLAYKPPADLSPAETCFLFSGLPLSRSIAATLLNMTYRGLVHVKRREGGKLFFTGPKISDNLHEHEVFILDLLQPDGSSFASIEKIIDRHESERFRSSVEQSLSSRGLIKGKQVNAFFVRALILTAQLLVLFIWWPLFVFSGLYLFTANAIEVSGFFDVVRAGAISTVIALVPFLFTSLFIMRFRAKLLGRRWMSTPRLMRLWPQMVGFREYCHLGEAGKLSYKDKAVEKKTRLRALPHAVAFGFKRNWRSIVE